MMHDEESDVDDGPASPLPEASRVLRSRVAALAASMSWEALTLVASFLGYDVFLYYGVLKTAK